MNIIRLHPDEYQKFFAIFVAQDQADFVRPVSEVLAQVDGKATVPYGIEVEDRPIGLFILDWSQGPNSVTLQSLQIDQMHQGHGYARRALEILKRIAAENGASEIVLRVNFRNLRALKLYEKLGFAMLEEPYLAGPSGPQHVMICKLG